MTDIPNIQPNSSDTTILAAPDKMVSVREMFGIDVDMECPAFSIADERVPDTDDSYVFDPDTTLAILAGFAHNRRVMVQGYGTVQAVKDVPAIRAKKEGVETTPVHLDQSPLSSVYDPGNPLADESGHYDGSNVDLVIEIADAREAQRSYEANLKLFDQARQMTQGLFELLRR